MTERGAPLPVKLVVRGLGDTPDPDWGEEGGGGAQRNFAYTTGRGELPLPPGRYRVRVHHGPEHTAHTEEFDVAPGAVTTVQAELEHVVETTGWLSADLHVHAVPSFDAPTLLADRVRSLAAVNVEVAVARDHNAVTDYRPTITSLSPLAIATLPPAIRTPTRSPTTKPASRVTGCSWAPMSPPSCPNDRLSKHYGPGG